MGSRPKNPNPEQTERDVNRIVELVRAVTSVFPVVDRALAEAAWEEHRPHDELASDKELAVAIRGDRLALVGRAQHQVQHTQLQTLPWFWPNGLVPLWTLSFYAGKRLLGRAYLEPAEARL